MALMRYRKYRKTDLAKRRKWLFNILVLSDGFSWKLSDFLQHWLCNGNLTEKEFIEKYRKLRSFYSDWKKIPFSKVTILSKDDHPDLITFHTKLDDSTGRPCLLKINVPHGSGAEYVRKNIGVDPEWLV